MPPRCPQQLPPGGGGAAGVPSLWGAQLAVLHTSSAVGALRQRHGTSTAPERSDGRLHVAHQREEAKVVLHTSRPRLRCKPASVLSLQGRADRTRPLNCLWPVRHSRAPRGVMFLVQEPCWSGIRSKGSFILLHEARLYFLRERKQRVPIVCRWSSIRVCRWGR